jgi:hypothetical protein
MPQIRTGTPTPSRRVGRKPLFDDQIREAASAPDKYIFEKNRCVKESIRHRAIVLGYTVTTFADDNGGYVIKIS